ncbi:hemerythrin domain-containing protein [Trichlorobacter ammonificans]|uniref:Hemerythrin HHE cation binding domain protein n=1 Tax=Trichlorobacter ammonificans TaxID=2916410 RepID=A0ABM9DA52_9BACT|nr:hemerythrin domain-containing protein [Trichlorobacter ammonificans]CAH2031491.1 Hemerythrin HHE cation binding domain protein [Trichlorobacter ammonificans]
MKTDITHALIEEHKLILRMIALLENNARRTAEGNYTTWQFYRDGIDFIRQYADRFHHAKEEDVLFTALIDNGMPREHSPVAAMLMEHERGRAFVGALEEAVTEAEAGNRQAYGRIAENALGYAALLRDHIAKEDGILYPLAERIVPEAMRQRIVNGYRDAEAKTPTAPGDHYRRLVEQYERE